MVRRKVEVRKWRAVREGNILVGSETNAAAGQRPIAVRGGGCWHRFVVVICSCLFVYILHCSLPSLALCLALDEVEGASC